MFRFEMVSGLYWLWIVPALILCYLFYIQLRKRQRSRLGSSNLLARLIQGEIPQRQHFKMVLITSAILSMLLAYANPQWGNKKEKVTARSSDIFVALDISQSMMAEDISPNRLERSKRLGQNLIRVLKGNRIGLIYFAGNAYLQMPLSNDYSAAQLFISSANTGQASTQGTAIGDAIDLSLRAYEEDKPTQRAMIIITDGENHDDEAVAAASRASAAGMNIYTIGVGTTEGSFVPFRTSGGEQYKRDESGNLVKSVLNQELINDLADAGQGKSYLIGEGNSIITDLKKEIERLEKQEVEQRAFTDYNSYFQYLIGIAIIFLLVYFLIPDSRNIVNA